MKEEWRPIPNYEGRYMISNHGRVLSLRHKTKIRNKVMTLKPGHYLMIGLSNKIVKTYPIHILVNMIFNGPKVANYYQTNHIDGNKHNNISTNLEWVTAKGNTRHAFKNNLRHPFKRPILCSNGLIFSSIRETASVLKTWPQNIGKVCRGIYSTHKGLVFSYLEDRHGNRK